MNNNKFDMKNQDIAWCPGCGNFGILTTLKATLSELDIEPQNLVMVSGIGQAAKIPHYLKSNVFNGLHGRALPPATAIKASNPSLTVIAESGDGDMYGEGGNHLIHTIRRNPDITNIIHNNMVYGLTKGQASPTSRIGFKTPVQTQGNFVEPINPLALAISLNASFVARIFAGDKEKSKEILLKAIQHKGYSLVDVLQPCISFNKTNTYKWFKDHTYYLDKSYDPNNKVTAFEKALEENDNKLPLGIIYRNSNRKTFTENQPVYKTTQKPLYQKKLDKDKLKDLINSKRDM